MLDPDVCCSRLRSWFVQFDIVICVFVLPDIIGAVIEPAHEHIG